MLVRHAIQNISYYREEFGKLGLCSDDTINLADLSSLPILKRESLYAGNRRIVDAGNRNLYGRLYPSSSSGTTGRPVTYIHDSMGESAGIAAGYALMSLSGWQPGDRFVHVWGNRVSVERWSHPMSRLKRLVMNQRNFSAYRINSEEGYRELLNFLQKAGASYLEGYAGVISGFAGWLEDTGQKVRGIKAVITTAENLTERRAEVIESALGPVYDMYGCGEINGIGLRPFSAGRFYVLDTHVVAEAVEIEGRREMVVTDLDNYYMPLIRYRIGDMVGNIEKPDEKASVQLSWFESIEGRSADVIRLNGNRVLYPVTVFGGTFIRRFRGIRRHKVEWDGRKLNFIFETSEGIDIHAVRNEIEKELSGYGLEYDIRVTDFLPPGRNGKYTFYEDRSVTFR